MSAAKHDQGKPPMHLLPWDALEEVARVLAHGAQEYGEHNWRKGLGRARLIGAAGRHMGKYLMGQDNDPDSGLCHLAHAACDFLFALSFHKEGREDDRYKSPALVPQSLVATAEALYVEGKSGRCESAPHR